MKTTLGVIFGNRDFFPDHLVIEARRDIETLFSELGFKAVMLGEHDTKLGSVETYEHAKACAELFKQHRDDIDGILVALPNFGDEKGVADTVKLSGLNVPILVQAYPDDLSAFNVERRRDAFCGKISVCNNLRQYGFPYTLTELHTVHPLQRQLPGRPAAICRRVPGGQRAAQCPPGRHRRAPDRFQHRALQRKAATGLRDQRLTVDLSEILGAAQQLADGDAAGQGQAGRNRGLCPARQRTAAGAWCAWPSWAS